MTALSPVPFVDLVRRMRREFEVGQAIFDLPVRKWFVPDGLLDFGAVHFGRRAATPVGPAAGPHTQLAQNIVLSWLAGGRIIELKTVQINDRLEIPRPCIHVPNVGYNVEWSQELTVRESVVEYVKAAFLIEILKHTRGFGGLPEALGFETVFDISVGYDLAGVQSDKVSGFIRALQEPAAIFDGLRAELTGDLAGFRDLALPRSISDCVTLSTFHGCPAHEIEAIARYLIEDLRLGTIIKLNPTLLGYDRVRELLANRLGYGHLELRREAFDDDLQYDDGLEMLRRLRHVADGCGSAIGAKFTNTLVVANDRAMFPTQTDPYMYLSGRPLHVIAMHLMQRFRDDLGFEFPVSFSAGVDAKNFPAAVACGMVPITTCTDLLRQGGYGRLPAYLRALAREMRRVGVTTRDGYVLAARGHGVTAAEQTVTSLPGGREIWERERARLVTIARDGPERLPAALREVVARAGGDGSQAVMHATRLAGRLNGRDLVPGLVADPRYHAESNAKPPRRIEKQLALYDCINCDLCISACPNDAIFAYTVEPAAAETEHLRVSRESGLMRRQGEGFTIREAHQLALVEAACNECSNCDVYCPEDGAPFRVKERVFLTREQFALCEEDGFCRDGDTLYARLDGTEMRLDVDPGGGECAVVGDGFRLTLSLTPFAVLDGAASTGPIEMDTANLWRMKTVWESIFGAATPNPVNPDPGAGR